MARMKEYAVTVTYVVDAEDRDDAVEIAKEVRATIASGGELRHPFLLRDVESQTIEEV